MLLFANFGFNGAGSYGIALYLYIPVFLSPLSVWPKVHLDLQDGSFITSSSVVMIFLMFCGGYFNLFEW